MGLTQRTLCCRKSQKSSATFERRAPAVNPRTCEYSLCDYSHSSELTDFCLKAPPSNLFATTSDQLLRPCRLCLQPKSLSPRSSRIIVTEPTCLSKTSPLLGPRPMLRLPRCVPWFVQADACRPLTCEKELLDLVQQAGHYRQIKKGANETTKSRKSPSLQTAPRFNETHC